MFQAAGDLGLGDEPLAADGILRVRLLNLFESHPPVQLGILGSENLSQSSRRVRPERPISRSSADLRAVALEAVFASFVREYSIHEIT
jgi:hypothetical protein